MGINCSTTIILNLIFMFFHVLVVVCIVARSPSVVFVGCWLRRYVLWLDQFVLELLWLWLDQFVLELLWLDLLLLELLSPGRQQHQHVGLLLHHHLKH